MQIIIFDCSSTYFSEANTFYIGVIPKAADASAADLSNVVPFTTTPITLASLGVTPRTTATTPTGHGISKTTTSPITIGIASAFAIFQVCSVCMWFRCWVIVLLSEELSFSILLRPWSKTAVSWWGTSPVDQQCHECNLSNPSLSVGARRQWQPPSDVFLQLWLQYW